MTCLIALHQSKSNLWNYKTKTHHNVLPLDLCFLLGQLFALQLQTANTLRFSFTELEYVKFFTFLERVNPPILIPVRSERNCHQIRLCWPFDTLVIKYARYKHWLLYSLLTGQLPAQ